MKSRNELTCEGVDEPMCEGVESLETRLCVRVGGSGNKPMCEGGRVWNELTCEGVESRNGPKCEGVHVCL